LMTYLEDINYRKMEFKYESKLVLYSYDSFLFDFNINDGTGFLNAVKNIIEQNGKFPTKISRGLNYHEMEDITNRI